MWHALKYALQFRYTCLLCIPKRLNTCFCSLYLSFFLGAGQLPCAQQGLVSEPNFRAAPEVFAPRCCHSEPAEQQELSCSRDRPACDHRWHWDLQHQPAQCKGRASEGIELGVCCRWSRDAEASGFALWLQVPGQLLKLLSRGAVKCCHSSITCACRCPCAKQILKQLNGLSVLCKLLLLWGCYPAWRHHGRRWQGSCWAQFVSFYLPWANSAMLVLCSSDWSHLWWMFSEVKGSCLGLVASKGSSTLSC